MDAAPKLVTVPYLYRGQMQLGVYMQVKTAFEKTNSQMSMIAHRWVEINHLRSVARRLRELEDELCRADDRQDASPKALELWEAQHPSSGSEEEEEASLVG